REHMAQVDFGKEDNWNDLPFLKMYSVNDPMAWRNYTQTYEYDEVGNIKQMKHTANGGNGGCWKRNYEYETANNKLNSTILRTGVDTKTYAYKQHPQHGFMVEMPNLKIMKWDHKDQLSVTSRQVVNNGGTPETTYYVHDSSGQRVRKITENAAAEGIRPSKKNERIYLGLYEIFKEHVGNNAGLERKTINVMDDKLRVALIETRNDVNDGTHKKLVRYMFSNHLGSALLEIEHRENPRVISYEEYHPFGTTAYQAVNKDIKASAKKYRYSSKERDEESGLYYYGARYYAPWLGRWTASDPTGLTDGSNLFVYVANNPVRFFDDNGEELTEFQQKVMSIVERKKVENKAKAEKLKQKLRKNYYDTKDEALAAKQQAEYELMALNDVGLLESLNPFVGVPNWFRSVSAKSRLAKARYDLTPEEWRIGDFTYAPTVGAVAEVIAWSSIPGGTLPFDEILKRVPIPNILHRIGRRALVRFGGKSNKALLRRVRAEMSKRGAGSKVTAGVYDTVTNEITVSSRLYSLDELHPVLKRNKDFVDWFNNYGGKIDPKSGKRMVHADVGAVSDALKAREKALGRNVTEADLEDLILHVEGKKGGAVPRCSRCSTLTSDVGLERSQEWAENEQWYRRMEGDIPDEKW
ncbi:MAG: RHS repeat domain-containing protein, partial [Candidatus Hodarchaeota archaeon]